MSLWKRLAEVFGGRSAAERGEAEQLLLEADFGVAATAEILERVAGVSDADLAAALEQAVAAMLAPLPSAAPPGYARARGRPPDSHPGVRGERHRQDHDGREARPPTPARRTQYSARGRRHLPGRRGRSTENLGGAAGGTVRGRPRRRERRPRGRRIRRDHRRARPRHRHRARGHRRPAAHRGPADRRIEKDRARGRQGAPGSGAPHESLLVLDGTTGQNAVQQGKVFAAAIPLTGLIVTKLDGTAKGGSVVALRRELALPIRFVGTGEGAPMIWKCLMRERTHGGSSGVLKLCRSH